MAAVNAQQGDTRVHVFKLVILNRVKTLHAPVSFSNDCRSCWRIFVSLHKDIDNVYCLVNFQRSGCIMYVVQFDLSINIK